MSTAAEAIAEAVRVVRLRAIADAGQAVDRARARSFDRGLDTVIRRIAPADVPGAAFALIAGQRLVDNGSAISAWGDLLSGESVRAAVGAVPARTTIATLAAPDFGGVSPLLGAVALSSLLGSTWMISATFRVDVSSGTALAPAGVVSDSDNEVGIGIYSSDGELRVVGWYGAAVTPAIPIRLGVSTYVEMERDEAVLTLRTALGTTRVAAPAIAAPTQAPIVVGSAHATPLDGVVAHLLIVDGIPSERVLHGSRAWAHGEMVFRTGADAPVLLAATASPGDLEIRPVDTSTFSEFGPYLVELNNGAGGTEVVTASGTSDVPYPRIVLTTPVVATYGAGPGSVAHVIAAGPEVPWFGFRTPEELTTEDGEVLTTEGGEPLTTE